MEANLYVKITQPKNDSPHCWYNNRVGEVFHVTDKLFEGQYNVIGRPNKRGLYPSIYKEDAIVLTPSLLKRILLKIKPS